MNITGDRSSADERKNKYVGQNVFSKCPIIFQQAAKKLQNATILFFTDMPHSLYAPGLPPPIDLCLRLSILMPSR